MRRHSRKASIAALLALLPFAGCASKAGNGALIGGGGGALIGAIIGNNSGGHGATGAVIGGAVGAVGGAIVGNEMDKNDKKKEEARYTNDYDRNFDRYGNAR